MDVDGVGEPATNSPAVYSVNVLHLIKQAQSQHGARYSDYQRYRRYCFSRLRRLYKSLKFLHGRGKYVKKMLDVSMVTDVRFLHIPLYSAERAWGYAMELKAIDSGPDLTRKRLHLIRRMRKAAKWADMFAKLCAEKSDSRTALEAEAYASYMQGTVLLEMESNWEVALSKFLRVRTVYEQLGKVGEVNHQVLCRQRVEEMEPNIRYCRYKMGQTDMKSAVIRELSASQENPTLDLLHSKLEAVMEEARSQQAATLTEFVWLGGHLPLHSAKTRLSILKVQELEADLAGANYERKLSTYDKIFVTYQEVKRQIRDDKVTAGNAEDVKEELTSLERAVTSLLLQRTMERNLVLVEAAKTKLERQNQGIGLKEEKATRPEDLIRLFDTLIQNVSDLSDIVTSTKQQSREVVKFAEELVACKERFQAFRCRYVAQSFAAGQKYPEAYVLYNKAATEAQDALDSYSQLVPSKPEELKELQDLVMHCREQRCFVHARYNMETAKAQDGVNHGVAKLGIKDTTVDHSEDRYLLDFIHEYRSGLAPGVKASAARILQIPPPFQAVPCRPIVLDTAVGTFDFPSLEGRVKQETKKPTGWLGGIFGRR